jgi:hypothetical protein
MKLIIRKQENRDKIKQLLKQKKEMTGLKEEEIITQAITEVSTEGLLFMKRIKSRYSK